MIRPSWRPQRPVSPFMGAPRVASSLSCGILRPFFEIFTRKRKSPSVSFPRILVIDEDGILKTDCRAHLEKVFGRA